MFLLYFGPNAYMELQISAHCCLWFNLSYLYAAPKNLNKLECVHLLVLHVHKNCLKIPTHLNGAKLHVFLQLIFLADSHLSCWSDRFVLLFDVTTEHIVTNNTPVVLWSDTVCGCEWQEKEITILN
jgi:hypothetical protein